MSNVSNVSSLDGCVQCKDDVPSVKKYLTSKMSLVDGRDP